MAKFAQILTASEEGLLKILYKSKADASSGKVATNPRDYARNLSLTYAQLICAVGFNPRIRVLPDVVALLGFESYDALARERNEIFTTDIYDRLGIKDVLAIYLQAPRDMQLLEVMQYLIKPRIEKLENRIEATVNSIVIERYKKEMRAIYNDGVAQIDFAEERMSNTHSGFRALLNEIVMMVEARLIPVGEVFFRDSVLPEEKRRMIIKGLIPRDLIESRLEDDAVPPQERKVLEEQLQLLDP